MMKIVLWFALCYLAMVGSMVNTWMTIWMLLEMALLALGGLLAIETKHGKAELVFKYFIVQIMAGLALLVSLLASNFIVGGVADVLTFFGLMTKLGLPPFHFWMIMILGKLSWGSLAAMLGISKFLPIMLISYAVDGLWLALPVWGAVLVGSICGLGNFSVQKLLGYSGMVSVAWTVYAATAGFFFFFFFWIGYVLMVSVLCWVFSMLNIYWMNQFKLVCPSLGYKISMFFICLGFSGIPPFFGFFLKWWVTASLGFVGFSFTGILLVCAYIFSFYYYLQLWFNFMLMFGCELKWFSSAFSWTVAGLGIYLVLGCSVLVVFVI